jgi:hypothetical protein
VKYANPTFDPAGIKGPQVTDAQIVNPIVTNPINEKGIAANGINLDKQTSAMPLLPESKASKLDKISNLEI